MERIEIIETLNGFSTIMKSGCNAGETVLLLKGIEVLKRTKYTIQIRENRHILPNIRSGRYINHSCNPNTILVSKEGFIALRDIDVGEEITFDYSTTENEIFEKFDCLCGNENCRKMIVGKEEPN